MRVESTLRGLFLLIAIMGLFVLSYLYAGKIEGHYFPVVTQVEVTSIEAVGDTRSRISGVFFKNRGYCDYRDVQFFLGSPKNNARADRVLEEGTKVRQGGWEDFGPWVVQLDMEQLSKRSFAVATHQCHPFWKTETIFYQ